MIISIEIRKYDLCYVIYKIDKEITFVIEKTNIKI